MLLWQLVSRTVKVLLLPLAFLTKVGFGSFSELRVFSAWIIIRAIDLWRVFVVVATIEVGVAIQFRDVTLAPVHPAEIVFIQLLSLIHI